MVSRLHSSGTEVRQSVMAEGHGGRELLSPWEPGSRKRASVQGARDNIIPKDIPPVTYFFQPSPPCLQLPPS